MIYSIREILFEKIKVLDCPPERKSRAGINCVDAWIDTLIRFATGQAVNPFHTVQFLLIGELDS